MTLLYVFVHPTEVRHSGSGLGVSRDDASPEFLFVVLTGVDSWNPYCWSINGQLKK
jgi:hypothetical protein